VHRSSIDSSKILIKCHLSNCKIFTPRFLKCIFVLSSEFPEYVGWTYNMSHERVSTLFPPSRPISRVSLFQDRMSIAREGVSFTMSHSSSFACVFLQHEVLVSRPQLSLFPSQIEQNHYDLPAELVSPSSVCKLASPCLRDNIFAIHI